MFELATVEAGLALAIDPSAPVELVLVTTAVALDRAPELVLTVVSRLPVLPGPEGVLLVEGALGLRLGVVVEPVELVALVTEVVEPVPPLAPPVLVDAEGVLALFVGVLLAALDAVVVAGRLPPLANKVLAWDR